MNTALTVLEPPALPAELTEPLNLAADFAKASKAPATQADYGSDFQIFEAWCRQRGLNALPANAAALCAFSWFPLHPLQWPTSCRIASMFV